MRAPCICCPCIGTRDASATGSACEQSWVPGLRNRTSWAEKAYFLMLFFNMIHSRTPMWQLRLSNNYTGCRKSQSQLVEQQHFCQTPHSDCHYKHSLQCQEWNVRFGFIRTWNGLMLSQEKLLLACHESSGSFSQPLLWAHPAREAARFVGTITGFHHWRYLKRQGTSPA